MEAEPSDESNNEVAESLDARVYNDATTLLPPETVKDPETKTSEPITPDPNAKLVYHVPNKTADTYELEKFKENRMIIFNHHDFEELSSRTGTCKDEAALIKTFKKFRFNIDKTHQDLEKTTLLETVKKFALKTDFGPYGCICVAILTHGYRKPGSLKAYDKRYKESKIFKPFNALKNPTLAGKPIIFIIQACRGLKPSESVAIGEKKKPLQLDHGDELKNYHIPTEADRIVFHSSYPGKAAIRDPDYGTWFIQALCEKINEFGLTHDLETIFRMVRRAVALHDDKEVENWKQMPVVTSTTLRAIKLAPTIQHDEDQPQPAAADAFESEMDDTQLSEKVEEHVPLGNPSSTLQHENEQPQPASPFIFCCEVHDPKVYPSSDQFAKILPKLVSANSPLDSGEASPMVMKLHHLPCCCFVEYFDYLKNCLETYILHNAGDAVARQLLAMAERTEPGQEFNLQRFYHIRDIWKHLESNQDSFPPNKGFSFVYRMYVPSKEDET